MALKDISDIVSIRGDYVLLGGSNGLSLLKVDSDRRILESIDFGQELNVSSMKVAGDLVFVGTWDNGLYYFNYRDKQPQIKQFGEVEFNDIVDLYYDERADEVWLAGSENIAMLKRTPFFAFGETGKYRIESFDYNENRDLYFTTGEEVFVHQDGESEKEMLFPSEDNFFTALKLFQDKLVVANQQGGLISYDFQRKTLYTGRQCSDIIISY